MSAPSSARGVAPMAWRALGGWVAAAVALSLTPAASAESVYFTHLYPRIQAVLTGASNLAPLAVFDVVCAVLIVAVVVIWGRAVRARSGGEPRGRRLVRALVRTGIVAATAMVWFQVAWGLNYARPPVDVRLALVRHAPTVDDVSALLERAVAGANRDHAAAHAAGFPGRHDVPIALVAALHDVERRDGRSRATVAARPKPTLLGVYFRMAGVDGLTAPAALETLLNPDLTGPERPFVLAHEWAHLAGYAPEADANFVAWRVTQRADVASRYSGWLFLLSEAAHQLPAATRRERLAALGDGPRQDLAAIDRRAAARVDVVQRVGWRVYDGYLRSQGVTEGVASYSRAVELIVRAERTHGSSLGIPGR